MSGWAIAACVAIPVVWALTILQALGVGHRHGARMGYEMGRHDQEHGIPRLQVVRLPARRVPDGGGAA